MNLAYPYTTEPQEPNGYLVKLKGPGSILGRNGSHSRTIG